MLFDCGFKYFKFVICRIAGIYYESFNFANFANQKALAKI